MINGLLEWEDLDDFFDIDEFAINATLIMRSPSVDDLALVGIFNTPYAKRDFGAFVVDADDPYFLTKWHDDFVHARKGDTLRITQADVTEDFFIDSGAQNSGTGVVSFVLTRESTQDDVGDLPEDSTDSSSHGQLPSGGLFAPNPGVS